MARTNPILIMSGETQSLNIAGRLRRGFCVALLIPLLAGCAGAPVMPLQAAGGSVLSAAQMERVGRRIWQNECGGTVAGLTSWNGGENFASLGIGHFIWYPAGQRGPFEESFPPLMAFFQQRSVAVPGWATGACPWGTKAAFEAEKNGPRLTEMRTLLARTTGLQTEFIVQRLGRAAAGMGGRAKAAYDALSTTPEGMFCLIDYVNFKGEGTNPKERYNGQGWGLMQVLEEVSARPDSSTAWHFQFAEAAKRVLSRRVANSPPACGEQRWLAGWHNRCDGYKAKL
jgi:hypothetical protein